MKTVALTVALLVVGYLLASSFVGSMDKQISHQDKMMCNSAKESGNREYLKKCECYYQSENISCIQGK